MKNKFLSLLLISFLLSGCKEPEPLIFAEYVPTLAEESKQINYETDSYYQKDKISPISAYNNALNEYKITSSKEILSINSGTSHKLLTSKENAKILVIPIAFKDSDNSISREVKENYIKTAFFGKEELTLTNSLASFYNKSSYNQLKITGEVTKWIELDYNANEWYKIDSTYNAAARRIVEDAFKQLVEEEYDLSYFGNEIDGIYAIYDYPYTTEFTGKERDNFFWAFCDYFTRSAPIPYKTSGFCWTSFYFLYNNGGKVDASTIIHEVGHLLGLEDYYNTDILRHSSQYHPTGFFDLMDSNIGDHNAFSKYLLDWYSPMVKKDNYVGKITLRDFSSTGDALLIPINNNYNDNPFGEYLMLEYFTPIGLNVSDGARYLYTDKNGEENIFEYPNFHGLKIYYIDARLGYFGRKKISAKYPLIATLDDPNALEKLVNDTNFFIDYKNNNSVKYEQVSDFNEELTSGQVRPLISLLESSGENTFKEGQYASNDTLFRYGSDIGYTNYIGLSKKINCKFKVTNIATNSVTITFENI